MFVGKRREVCADSGADHELFDVKNDNKGSVMYIGDSSANITGVKWSKVEDLVVCAGLQRMLSDENDGLEDIGVWSIHPRSPFEYWTLVTQEFAP